MFKIGDYVTGVDRSYKRSIYRVNHIVDSYYFDLAFICLNGRLGKPEDILGDRNIVDFRLALAEEISEELGFALKMNLIRMVAVLIASR